MERNNLICKNCGNEFAGNYCNACGEKVYNEEHKKISHLVEEVIHFVTHFEGSLFRTIKTVFTSPGKFSLDYCNGIRKKYFKPVSFFFVFVVLYLLFPRYHGLNMKLESYVDKQYGFTGVSVPLAKGKMKSRQVTFPELAKHYNSKSASVSKIGLFLIIPLAACLILFLFFSTKKSFFDHFIISLELSSLFIAIHFLIIPFLSFITEMINRKWSTFFRDDNYWLEIITVLLNLTITSIAFKKFYVQKWGWVIVKAIIYIFIFNFFILYVYRLLVLLFTMMLI
ncbi:MAG: DUF3667 domain-containing protein [Chitinophagaceae bacterium]